MNQQIHHLLFSESLLKFTKYVIPPPRIKFCKTHPYRYVDDMSYFKLGVAPGSDVPPELQIKVDILKSQQSEERYRDDSTSDQEGDLKLPKIVA